jgi:hypothetical protein
MATAAFCNKALITPFYVARVIIVPVVRVGAKNSTRIFIRATGDEQGRETKDEENKVSHIFPSFD